MGEEVLQNAKVIVNYYDISGWTNQINLAYGAEVKDITALGDTARTKLAGLKTVEVTGQGYYVAPQPDQNFFGQVGLNADQVALLASGSAGAKAFAFEGGKSAYSPGGTIGDVHSFDFAMFNKGPLYYGTSFGLIDITGAGAQSSIQLGAVAAGQKIYAGLHILAHSGTLDVDIRLQSDADDNWGAGATDQVTWAAQSAIAYDLQSVDGAITDEYWRWRADLNGGSGSMTVLVWAAIQ